MIYGLVERRPYRCGCKIKSDYMKEQQRLEIEPILLIYCAIIKTIFSQLFLKL